MQVRVLIPLYRQDYAVLKQFREKIDLILDDIRYTTPNRIRQRHYVKILLSLFSNQLNHKKNLLHFTKVRKQTFFAVNDARCARIMKPLGEKTPSMGADVAGIDKYFNASSDKHGYKSFLVKSQLG